MQTRLTDKTNFIRLLLTPRSWFLCSILFGSVLTPSFVQAQVGNSASFAIPKRDDPRTLPENTESESRNALREERIRSIQRRIDTLKEVLSRQQQESSNPAEESGNENPMNQRSSNVSTEIDQKLRDLRNLQQAEPTDNESQNQSADEPAIDPAEPGSGELDLQGIPVITSPVNSFELANSLFLTGHYAQALRAYEDLLKTKDRAIDQDWLRLQAANCYRIRGEIGTAEQLYRDVTASKEKSYPSDHAKWYLNYLTRRKQVEAEIQAIEYELQSLTPNLP